MTVGLSFFVFAEFHRNFFGKISPDPGKRSSEQTAGVDEGMIADTDIEAWLAPLRPSPADLAAGAALIASQARVEDGGMLRYVGERSASKMLGEMMGAPPGQDSSADAAWRFLASPAALELNEALSESLAGAVHTERKEDVMRLLAKLLTAQGLQYLRAFAHELWLLAGSPCATTPGQPTAPITVDWPACWAWCVAPSRPNVLECANYAHSCLLDKRITPQGLSHRGHSLQ
jgi:hypothetical protein